MKFDMRPKRVERPLADGRVEITITPPAWSQFSESSVITLSAEQYVRYKKWLAGTSLISKVFPEFTAAQRETLLSGIRSEEWDSKVVRTGEGG